VTLLGRHAVVTGGGRGLGAAITAALETEGATVSIMGRTHGIQCDVADAASIARAFEQAREAGGPVDILVNNAGQSLASAFDATSLDAWNQLLAVNLTGTFLCTQQVLPSMLAAGAGRIVNIASTTGVRGYAMAAAYCASKHGVVGMTRALGIEVARTGVTVNALCPGYIEGTGMFDTAMENVMRATGKPAADVRAMLAKGSPQGTLTTPQEVAEAVVWLCSSAGAAVNGKAIMIPGREVL
jgi:NAD(P)-dependent dehydrogenase (short-subunit alcohol dehydrogenase family)